MVVTNYTSTIVLITPDEKKARTLLLKHFQERVIQAEKKLQEAQLLVQSVNNALVVEDI